jgi:hypothetical protein
MAENGHLRIDTGLGDGAQPHQRPPPIAAAFCVIFDARKGYTLAWRDAIEGLDIDGIVEYKSLPSGLHTVEEDLVYFVHEHYAGISAFLNKECKVDARGARMLATGVLVPIQDSRMGRAWLHAEGLKELVGKQIGNPEDVSLLEGYWDEFKMKDERKDATTLTDDVFDAGTVKKPNGYQKTRAMSDAMPAPSQGLPLHHPAKALAVLFKAFGPLVFPLYRAALLRKRILLVGEAPVETNCNFVYAISILSSIQKVLLPLLPVDDVPDMRLRPLFNVGIQDIPLLQRSKDHENEIQDGWIACTTDDVLATKPELFDLLVMLPPPHSKNATSKIYPKIIPSSPDLSRKTPKTTTRATQRDARRFISLRAHLKQFAAETARPPEAAAAIDAETESVSSAAESTLSRTSIVEPQPWSHIAYISLLWWASAGEKRSGPDEDEDEEADHDAHLLGEDDDSSSAELAIVSYFHRLTNAIFGNISSAIAQADGDELWERAGIDVEDDDAESEEDEAAAVTDGETNEDQALLSNKANDSVVEITREDLTSMGLDIWSSSDRTFVEDLVRMWWGREAVVKGSRIECCGVQIL